MQKKTTNDFINRAIEVHNNKYNYSLADYKGYDSKIKIICSIHGIFEQMPIVHLRGCGCPICGKIKRNINKKSTTEKFINKAILKHGNKYDYSLVDYKGYNSKVKIICPIHGVFKQAPEVHLRAKTGCFMCSSKEEGDRRRFSLSEFIEKSIKIHGNRYDYSLVSYKDLKTKIKIICPIHGVFEQMPVSHIHHKSGCISCCGSKKPSTEEFIKKAKKIHGDKYDYSLVDYKNAHSKIKIICKHHGEFNQQADSHLKNNGCPMCCCSKGEEKIRNWLIENKFSFIEQHRFKNCKQQRSLPFDFYLSELNICIEYDGIQHFKSIEYFGGDNILLFTQKTDRIKTKYCKKNKIKLIRVNYLEYNNLENKLKSKLKLKKKNE